MTKQEAHKAIVVLHDKVQRLQRLKLAALAIYSLERQGAKVVKFYDNEEGRVVATLTDDGRLVVDWGNKNPNKVYWNQPIEVIQDAILKEVLS